VGERRDFGERGDSERRHGHRRALFEVPGCYPYKDSMLTKKNAVDIYIKAWNLG
jgi:hypothetical protein